MVCAVLPGLINVETRGLESDKTGYAGSACVRLLDSGVWYSDSLSFQEFLPNNLLVVLARAREKVHQTEVGEAQINHVMN